MPEADLIDTSAYIDEVSRKRFGARVGPQGILWLYIGAKKQNAHLSGPELVKTPIDFGHSPSSGKLRWRGQVRGGAGGGRSDDELDAADVLQSS